MTWSDKAIVHEFKSTCQFYINGYVPNKLFQKSILSDDEMNLFYDMCMKNKSISTNGNSLDLINLTRDTIMCTTFEAAIDWFMKELAKGRLIHLRGIYREDRYTSDNILVDSVVVIKFLR